MTPRIVAAAVCTAWILVGWGCSVTPHVNVGVGLDYYGGEFRLRPHANVGVYGRP